VGPALPAIVTVERLAGRVGTVEIVDDPENLKGRLYKKRRQTSARRQVDWSVVGKCDEIVMLERRAQTFPVGRGAVNEDRPEALWLGRLGKRGERTARWTSGTGTTWKRLGGWAIASLLPRGSALMPARSAE